MNHKNILSKLRGDLSDSRLRGDLNLRGDLKFEGGPKTPLHAMLLYCVFKINNVGMTKKSLRDI